MNKHRLGIYFISLDKDIDRRNNLKIQFRNQFEEMIHISAVYGKSLNVDTYYQRTASHYSQTGKLLSPGELGCIMSHENSLKAFLESDNKYALILEDDVIGTDIEISKIKNIAAKIKGECFIHCGGMDGRGSEKYIYGYRTDIDETIYTLSKFSYRHLWRACCYIVDKNTAKKLLDIYSSNLVAADHWNIILNKINTNTYVANLLHHPIELTNSNLENDRLMHQNKNENIFYYIKMARNKIVNIVNVFILKIQGYKKIYE